MFKVYKIRHGICKQISEYYQINQLHKKDSEVTCYSYDPEI